MPVKEILLLGNPALYTVCTKIKKEELPHISTVVQDLHDTLLHFRDIHNTGRAIAAPQIGVMKQLIYMYIDTPTVFINPNIKFTGNETITLWDDCMSFPHLLVKVIRNRYCTVHYKDLQWKDHSITYQDDLSELIQHEYDHLNGILAVSRAIDKRSFCLRTQKKFIETKEV
ncbi:MAG: peptide deformylase [Candidatus Methanofastidiosia archaeon]|jgi:peptide deformylase